MKKMHKNRVCKWKLLEKAFHALTHFVEKHLIFSYFVAAKSLTRDTRCNFPVKIQEHPGYLLMFSNSQESSINNRYETHLDRECTIQFSARQGQRINITTIDLSPKSIIEESLNSGSADKCPLYALMTENDKIEPIYLCGEMQLKRHIYESSGKDLEFQLHFMSAATNHTIILQYSGKKILFQNKLLSG